MTVNIVILSLPIVDNFHQKRLIFINFGTTFEQKTPANINIFNLKNEF